MVETMQQARSSTQLVRGLTLPHTVSLVVGGVIGTGIFLKTATMSHYVQSPKWVLLAWFVAGVLSLMGALVYAEISRLVPKTGGEYAYLRETYGPAPAYMFGWMRVAVGAAGSIAAYAIGMSDFLFPMLQSWFPSISKPWVVVPFGHLFPSLHELHPWVSSPSLQFINDAVYAMKKSLVDFTWDFGPKQVVAVSVILFFSFINCLGVRAGGRIQTILTMIKVSGMLLIAAGVLFLSSSASLAHLAPASGGAWKGWSLFGMAMLQALWAYDGWNLTPMVAGEVRDPTRNVARALIFGMLGVFLIYVLLSFFYFYALPFEQILQAKSKFVSNPNAKPVATMVVQSFAPHWGWKLASLLFVLSSVGALNGSILTSARVPFAMAQDGLFFRRLGEVSPRSKVPFWSIVAQAIWSSVIALSGSYDAITDAVLFASWIFYGITAIGYFKIYRRYSQSELGIYRLFIVPGFCLVFSLVALALVINSCYQNPWGSFAGAVLMLLGVPFYLVFRKKSRSVQ